MKSLVTFILGLAATAQALNCTSSRCDKKSAVNPNTCVTHENGTGKSWMDMADQCITLGGRLLILPSNNDTLLKNLYQTSPLIQNINGTSDSVVLALMSSMKNDGNVFLYEKKLITSTNCGNIDTTTPPCLPPSSTPDQKKCESIGCCWKNAMCSYPSQALMYPFSTFSIPIPLNNTVGRGCVYMEKQNSSFTKPKWTEKDCFAPSVNTAYICEFVCKGSFPTRPTVTQALPHTTGISTVADVTKTGTTISGSTISGSTISGSTSIKGAKNSRNSGSKLRQINMLPVLLAFICCVSMKSVVTGH